MQLNEDVSINSLRLLRFVQRQPSGLPGGLVAYFIQGFFFLSAADTFDNQTVWGRGLLISEKGLEKGTSEGRFFSSSEN